MHLRHGRPEEPCKNRAQCRRYEQNGRLPRHFLPTRCLDEVPLEPFSQPWLEARRTPGGANGVAQHLFDTRVEGDHRELL